MSEDSGGRGEQRSGQPRPGKDRGGEAPPPRVQTHVDYYGVLGVKKDATAEDIKKGFRALARQLHPDINPDPAAQEKLKAINTAYDTVGDETKRKEYDDLRALQAEYAQRASRFSRPDSGFTEDSSSTRTGGSSTTDHGYPSAEEARENLRRAEEELREEIRRMGLNPDDFFTTGEPGKNRGPKSRKKGRSRHQAPHSFLFDSGQETQKPKKEPKKPTTEYQAKESIDAKASQQKQVDEKAAHAKKAADEAAARTRHEARNSSLYSPDSTYGDDLRAAQDAFSTAFSEAGKRYDRRYFQPVAADGGILGKLGIGEKVTVDIAKQLVDTVSSLYLSGPITYGLPDGTYLRISSSRKYDRDYIKLQDSIITVELLTDKTDDRGNYNSKGIRLVKDEETNDFWIQRVTRAYKGSESTLGDSPYFSPVRFVEDYADDSHVYEPVFLEGAVKKSEMTSLIKNLRTSTARKY